MKKFGVENEKKKRLKNQKLAQDKNQKGRSMNYEAMGDDEINKYLGRSQNKEIDSIDVESGSEAGNDMQSKSVVDSKSKKIEKPKLIDIDNNLD